VNASWHVVAISKPVHLDLGPPGFHAPSKERPAASVSRMGITNAWIAVIASARCSAAPVTCALRRYARHWTSASYALA